MSSSTNMESNLPPLPAGVFTVSASALIDAPRDKVWDILLDFPSYKEWNPFARGQTVVDASKKPLASQTPHAGQHLLIAPVHIPPTMGAPGLFQVHSAFEVITVLDHARGRAAWANVEMPGWLLGAERWQAVSTVEVAGGGTRTRYETAEVFTGLLAYVVKWVMRGKLAMGFEAMAEGLKARAEGLERGA